MEKVICKNCKTEFSGNYCPNCGEKVLTKKDFELKNFLLQGIDIFTHVDNKFFKTILSLIKNPGELSHNNWEGRRVPYAKPLQIFLVLNALFFILNSSTFQLNFFNTPLKNHLNYFRYSEYAKAETEKIIKEKNISFEDFEKKFNIKSDNLSKSLIFIMIPILGLLSWFVFRKQRKYYVQHLIFATHFYSFVILYGIIMILLTILVFILKSIIPPIQSIYILNDNIFSVLAALFLSYYFYRSFKRCYHLNTIKNILTTSLFVFSTFYILQFYRFVMFIIVKESIS